MTMLSVHCFMSYCGDSEQRPLLPPRFLLSDLKLLMISLHWADRNDILLELVEHFTDIIEDLFLARLFICGCDEIRWKRLPRVEERIHPCLGIGTRLAHAELVGFGEDDGERDIACPEPVDKLAVELLLLVADVNEHKDIDKLLTLEDIGAYHAVELVTLRLRTLGIAIAREVNEIPLAVDDEVVDEQRLTGDG